MYKRQKTDRYSNPQDMLDRYQAQLELYAEALRRSYGVDCIESYLILLGGEQLQVVSLADSCLLYTSCNMLKQTSLSDRRDLWQIEPLEF